MATIYVPKREGMYRVQCECGSVTESHTVFNPDRLLDEHVNEFCNKHAGSGHRGILEIMERGIWRKTPLAFSPMTEADWETVERMGGL